LALWVRRCYTAGGWVYPDTTWSKNGRTKNSIRYALEGKMYSSFEGMWSKAVIFSWKLFAMTSFGT